MFLSKVKFVAIVVLAVGLAGSGVGFLRYHTSAGQPESKPAAPERKERTQVVATALRADKAIAPAPAKAASDSRDWPDKLEATIDYPGIDDVRATLSDALDMLAKRYNLTFDINKKAFDVDQLNDVARTPVAETPIPTMHARLSTVLHKILARVPSPSGTTYIIRRDLIEITTELFVRAELGIPESRPLLPLVWDTLDNTPFDAALRKLARQSGYNVVIDPRIADKLQTPATAELNNVPIDTAVRLLANMAGMSVVRLDNVFYVTTADNAKKLSEEQAKINAETPTKDAEPPKKPASEKRAKKQ